MGGLCHHPGKAWCSLNEGADGAGPGKESESGGISKAELTGLVAIREIGEKDPC